MAHYYLPFRALGHEECSEIEYEEAGGFFSSYKYKGTVYYPGGTNYPIKFNQEYHLHAFALKAYAKAAQAVYPKVGNLSNNFTDEENTIFNYIPFRVEDIYEELDVSYFYPATKKFKVQLNLDVLHFGNKDLPSVISLFRKYGLPQQFCIIITNDSAGIYDADTLNNKNVKKYFSFQNPNLVFLRLCREIVRVQPFSF